MYGNEFSELKLTSCEKKKKNTPQVIIITNVNTYKLTKYYLITLLTTGLSPIILSYLLN